MPEQWDWKPYSECMSIKEIIAHLISDDRAALNSMKSGKEPDYAAFQEAERDLDKLLELLASSHKDLLNWLCEAYQSTPLDTMVSIWGMKMPLASAIAAASSEEYYHSGQVAFIRLATDPKWDYYSSIYDM